jgi:hypothetical protein
MGFFGELFSEAIKAGIESVQKENRRNRIEQLVSVLESENTAFQKLKALYELISLCSTLDEAKELAPFPEDTFLILVEMLKTYQRYMRMECSEAIYKQMLQKKLIEGDMLSFFGLAYLLALHFQDREAIEILSKDL